MLLRRLNSGIQLRSYKFRIHGERQQQPLLDRNRYRACPGQKWPSAASEWWVVSGLKEMNLICCAVLCGVRWRQRNGFDNELLPILGALLVISHCGSRSLVAVDGDLDPLYQHTESGWNKWLGREGRETKKAGVRRWSVKRGGELISLFLSSRSTSSSRDIIHSNDMTTLLRSTQFNTHLETFTGIGVEIGARRAIGRFPAHALARRGVPELYIRLLVEERGWLER